MKLYGIPPGKLDTFIYEFLQPGEQFLTQVGVTVDKICSFLKEHCNSIKISKTVKGGSLGKGTALKNGSDADLVIFLNHFRCFEDQKRNRAENLKIIHEELEACRHLIGYDIIMSKPKIIPSHSSPRSLNFQLKATEHSDYVEVDVLPAFDALGQLTKTPPNPQVYEDLINTREPGGEFSTCFTELQRDFVKSRPTKLKGLIRLVKHWYIQYVKARKSELRAGERLPPKYALELLTIHAWEQDNHKESFDTAEGFRTVLELICRHRELCIYWTDYYDVTNGILAEFISKKLHERRPIILDPADPTGNLTSSDGWNVIEDEAKKCLCMPCVSNVRAWHVQPVKRFTVTVTDLDGRSLQVNTNIYTSVSEIKHNVDEKWKIPGPLQHLLYHGTIMNEDKTLLDYKIFFDTEIQLIRQMAISVESPMWKMTVEVSQEDKVSKLKHKIESQRLICRSQYNLTFKSKVLEDGKSLVSYGIHHLSIVKINLQLQGGGNIQLF